MKYEQPKDSFANNVSEPTVQESDKTIYDLICVGFGPASLAIAIALYDSQIQPPPKVLFLEKQTKFIWHAGMLLPGSRMQISFIKDLATLRNPRSEFTFLNYLHANDRLVQFTNLGTFLPLREEYNDYMQWCARKFNDVVTYSEEVVGVKPNTIEQGLDGVESFVVSSKVGGIQEDRVARHVLIAVGGRPNIPNTFPQKHTRVVHSSKYASSVPQVLSNTNESYNIAVIGGGQSAAEIFSDLHEKYPNATVTLFLKGSALRPSDDSPFVNEVFNPDRVDDTFSMPADTRQQAIAEDRATNYGVVRLELLERLYDDMYTQKLRDRDESTWKLRIRPRSEIESARAEGDKVVLKIRHFRPGPNEAKAELTREFDLAIVATGYQRNLHEEILSSSKILMAEEDRARTVVGRDYRVKFADGTISPDAGIWLQGCNESTHGLSDTLLSILSIRAGEVVDSIFGTTRSTTKSVPVQNNESENGLQSAHANSKSVERAHLNENGNANGHASNGLQV